MLVTFISECEKNSLKKTRRVLDAFANRIGNNTWQTPITQEGLEAVKKLLKQTASKNTAVSCHQLKSRVRTELLWVVGNRNKFNSEGVVAVNYTEKDILKNYYENDWRYLPLIEALSVFAALLHDFGKASILFQKKLKGNKIKIEGNPLRHEWVSVLFLVAIVNGRDDKQWLSELALNDNIHNTISKLKITNLDNPLANLPPIASLVAWLVLTHHKMPEIEKYSDKQMGLKQLFNVINKDWGYQTSNDKDYQEHVNSCLKCSELPSQSIEWQSEIKKYAIRLKNNATQFEAIYSSDALRVVMLYSRLSLMLGDHYYSSLDKDKSEEWHSNLKLFANTDKSGKLKQQLDEHLVRVAQQTKINVNKLPDFEGVFNRKIRVENKSKLQAKSKGNFKWQDSAVIEIEKWRKNEQNLDKEQFGFFAVNIASTGTGKTFSNAKIMQALSPNEASLRYILALGLRTLTLQTGDEYKNKIGLNKEELAVLIGSKAILALHNQAEQLSQSIEKKTGSESSENLSDGELIFEGSFSEDGLNTILNNKKHRQFLHAPVLTCTIDHIVKATEITRGGQYILPTLRLMSSDLVIDEIDDFDGTDLIAIGRLIHLAGMLGRKVMISSATIPPDLAEGYFNAYQSGWLIFSAMRHKNKNIGCAWVDEFKTTIKSISSKEVYQNAHQDFIVKRIKSLNTQPAKRKVNIVKCDTDLTNFPENYFSTIKVEICIKHKQHCFVDEKTGKNISIGVVRMANVKPCIELTRFLLNNNKQEGIEIKTIPYHSRQVLLMRHEQEKYLDKILKRKDGNQHILDDDVIRKHIDNSKAKNIIFVLVATPVEEVGRDHDFDWAIIEPSSYRSFIQLAGRVLRHREVEITKPNIAILQYNYRTIQTAGKKVQRHHQFQYPGYQKNYEDLSTFDLEKLVNTDELARKLDATNRIQKTKTSELANLEHKVIAELLTNYEKEGANTMQGWLNDIWWLSGVHQKYIRFRNDSKDDIQYLFNDEFGEKDSTGEFKAQSNIQIDELNDEEESNLWFKRDYKSLLVQQAKDRDLKKTALTYGEITLPSYGKHLKENQFVYNSQLGLCDKK